MQTVFALPEEFETFEIRWFKSGTLPGRWIDAHRSLGYGGSVSSYRLDRYLRLIQKSATDTPLSVKWRDGLIEIKRLVNAPHLEQLPSHKLPLPSRWLKWSWSPAGCDGSVFPPSDWIEVEKNRRLVTLQPQHNGSFSILPYGSRSGIRIELTEMNDLNGNPWWTLSFECETCIALTALFFLSQVKFFLRFFPMRDLDDAHISGYPSWLTRTWSLTEAENFLVVS